MKTTLIAAFTATATLTGAGQRPPAPSYSLTKTIPLGAPDRWDYAVFDPATVRVYIAHGDRLTVLDARTGGVVGQVEGIPGGTHGRRRERRGGRLRPPVAKGRRSHPRG